MESDAPWESGSRLVSGTLSGTGSQSELESGSESGSRSESESGSELLVIPLSRSQLRRWDHRQPLWQGEIRREEGSGQVLVELDRIAARIHAEEGVSPLLIYSARGDDLVTRIERCDDGRERVAVLVGYLSVDRRSRSESNRDGARRGGIQRDVYRLGRRRAREQSIRTRRRGQCDLLPTSVVLVTSRRRGSTRHPRRGPGVRQRWDPADLRL